MTDTSLHNAVGVLRRAVAGEGTRPECSSGLPTLCSVSATVRGEGILGVLETRSLRSHGFGASYSFTWQGKGIRRDTDRYLLSIGIPMSVRGGADRGAGFSAQCSAACTPSLALLCLQPLALASPRVPFSAFPSAWPQPSQLNCCGPGHDLCRRGHCLSSSSRP